MNNKLMSLNKTLMFWGVVCTLSLFSCKKKYPNDSILEFKPNCSSEKLQIVGFDINDEKVYDDKYGALIYKNVKIQRFKFKNSSQVNPDWMIFEVIKDNEISYLVDSIGIEYNNFKEKKRSYRLNDCFSYDLNNDILKNIGWESQLKFLTLFYGLFHEGDIYRKRLPSSGKKILKIYRESIELPDEIAWTSRTILFIPLDYGLYKLFCIENQNYEISTHIVKSSSYVYF